MISLVQDDLKLAEALVDRVLDGDRPQAELLTELAELLFDRSVPDDRDRRRVAEAVRDRGLVVEDLLRQRVELDPGQVRRRGGQTAVGAEGGAGLLAVEQEVHQQR